MAGTSRNKSRENVGSSSRVPPTASNRRRARVPPTHVEEEVEEVKHAEEVEQVSEEEVEPEDEPFPGGPINKSLLRSFKFHRAYSIWETQATNNLKCVSHGKKIMNWTVLTDNQPGYVALFNQLVDRSGLRNLMTISYPFVNKVLITSFVERWQPETNTFHLPFGEMTITLDDVSSILGLSVEGRAPTTVGRLSISELAQLAIRWLGVTERDIYTEFDKNNGGTVRLEWLKEVSEISTSSSTLHIEQAARGYLLYLLGCTIFSDKTGTKVSIRLLSLLTDLHMIHTYAWGAAALTYLYRQLGMASRVDTAQISGYLTLVQAWVFEYFPSLRVHRNMNFRLDSPRAMRWCPSKEDGNISENLRDIRERLDILKPSEVIWTPYADSRDYLPFHEISFFVGCLKCMEIVEPYHPDRVLRQFGYVQTIPRAPFEPVRAHSGRNAMTYLVRYNFLQQYFEGWENHVLSQNLRGSRARIPYQVAQGYIEWFSSVSHVAVQNPLHRTQYDPNTETGDYTTHVYQQALPIIDHAHGEGSSQSSSSMWTALNSIHQVFHGERLIDSRKYFRRNRRGA